MMYAARHKKTGKYMPNFSGSFPHYVYSFRYDSKKQLGRFPTTEEVMNTVFTLDEPSNAKVYMTQGALKSSFGALHETRGYEEFVEIVKLKLVLDEEQP